MQGQCQVPRPICRTDVAVRFHSFTLVLILVASSYSVFALDRVSSEDVESPIFSSVSEADNYSVGWIKNGQSYLSGDLFYPSANGSGSWADMAENGSPFPVLYFFIDDGESADNYDWISQSIASAGYIVFVLEDDHEPSQSSILLRDINRSLDDFVYYNNTTLEDGGVRGFFGGFDLDHWGVSGHGKGAANALVVNGGWGVASAWPDFSPSAKPPPRSLFGLGLDNTDLVESVVTSSLPPNPNFSFFLTGTVDEIAPPNQHIKPTLEDWTGAWQLQEVLGANHLQYMDDNSWLQGFSDGSATMSRSEQQTQALEHLIPYLDLVLKGNHASWIQATSRENDILMPSDSEAYLSEELESARLLFSTAIEPSSQFVDLGQLATISMDVLHRNGDLLLADDPGLVITCFVVGSDVGLTNGSLDWANAKASCNMVLDELAPGYYQVGMTVSHNGMPVTNHASIVRNNSPLIAIDPTPYISLDQHSSVEVNASEFAFDPDGQEVYFSNASWVGDLGDELTISLNGPNMTITHTGEAEFSGTILVSMTLVETGSQNPAYLNLTTHVSVLPIDDQVEVLGQIPRQEFAEDSEGLILNLSQWFADPEGGPIIASVSSSAAGLNATVVGDELLLSSGPDWNGAAIITLTVNDGSTNPVYQDVPVVVNPVDDEPRYNASAWNISVDEDSSVVVDLHQLAYDPDGNELNYTWLGSAAGWTVNIDGQEMTIIPPPQDNGLFNIGFLNASDGVFEIGNNLSITVNPIPDPPQVSWKQYEVVEDMLITHYTFFDEDSPESHQVLLSIDSGAWAEQLSVCTQVDGEGQSLSGSGVLECTVSANISALQAGSHSISLVVKDGSFSTDSHQFVFSMGGEEEVNEEKDTLSALLVNPIAQGVIVAVILVAIVMRGLRGSRMKSELAQIVQEESGLVQLQGEVSSSRPTDATSVQILQNSTSSSEKVEAVGKSSSTNGTSGGEGLLDRANRLK